MAVQVPIFINCRDRVEPLLPLLAWLERAGHERITLVDNDSTYPPMLALLDETPHEVVRLGRNLGQLAPWTADLLPADELFVVTDPDVVPVEECPLDAVDRFREMLEGIPQCGKVGFGLVCWDLPERYRFSREVARWEAQFWQQPIAGSSDPTFYWTMLDTTFALYRPGLPFNLANAVRSGPPYVARHLGWYVDSDDPTEEERYYLDHADLSVTSWSGAELRAELEAALRHVPTLPLPVDRDPSPRPRSGSTD